MRVRDWMTPGVVLLTSETSILEALRFVNSKGIDRLGVIRAGHILGIVTRNELYAHLEGSTSTLVSRRTLGDAVPRIPVFLTIDDSLDEAARQFHETGRPALAVLDGGEAAGIITPWDLCRAFRQVFGPRLDEAPQVILLNASRERDLLDEIRHRTHHTPIQSLLAYPASGREWQVMIRLAPAASPVVTASPA